ncbi:LuxR regulatory protein [Streptomyces sp. L-9-10]|uniref:AAA family ATPase n=1 Tax=Streptomyces sp. L-9-10 TaxID=1478131 RepID=UPI0010D3C547|nr:LuxR family transcriptional regulator [Streptomyces sp. L-9-10]RYJ23296.1 LuxR regulatory protein [Streptomyces sp. L-9-10]
MWGTGSAGTARTARTARQGEDTRGGLYGRDPQIAALRRLVRDALKGHGGSLVLEGERGIGKSTLLEHVGTTSSGVRVVRVAGTGAERRLPYAALQRVFAALRDHVPRLPPRQRETVEAMMAKGAVGAVGPSPAPRAGHPDALEIGLALLQLLSTAAAVQPLLCLHDDAHLLDQPSREALAIAARRCGDARVACLFTLPSPLPHSDDCPELASFPRMRLSGLTDRDALALLRAHLPAPLDPSVCERVVADAHGNPRALLAVPHALSPTEMASVRPPARESDGWLPPDRMRDALNGLPDAARQVLLVAAAEPLGDPVTVLRATEALGLRGADVTEAESSGLIVFGPGVRFAHPLLRTYVYARASVTRRRLVHDALAGTCDVLRVPEQHAWHLGQAAASFDEGVAARLQAAAEQRLTRHETRTAAALLELAALLTADRRQRASRLLAAASAWRRGGGLRHALDLLGHLQLAALPRAERTEATGLHARTRYSVDRDGPAARALHGAAEHARVHDVRQEGIALLEALSAGVLAGRRLPAEALRTAAARACEFSTKETARETSRETAARPHESLLSAVAAHTLRGYGPAVQPMRRAVDAYLAAPAHTDLDVVGGWLACHAAVGVWDGAAWRALADRRTAAARRLSAVTALPWGLTHQALADIHHGDLAQARVRVAEAYRVSEAIGAVPLDYAALALAAWTGRRDTVEALAETGARDAAAREEGRLLTAAECARAVLYNSRGRYGQAFEVCAEAVALDELAYRNWLLPELVEAAVRTGHQPDALAAAARLEECARLTGSDWARGLHLRARALLSDGDEADGLFRESACALTAAGALLQAGRSHLLWGEWLRRQARMSAARIPLRAAYDVFSRAGAWSFRERCGGELAAAGARVPRSEGGEPTVLTAQEQRIAQRVARGDTSKEVAAALYLSRRTVDTHLRSIFRKLGISSRRQLRDHAVAVTPERRVREEFFVPPAESP